ncbi:MAG: hypothetical protein JXO51_03115 [Candidatus Aminicenantes bacterium]|nr:hypothetical protein [Candidatus Aminicenantes bacterium]
MKKKLWLGFVLVLIPSILTRAEDRNMAHEPFPSQPQKGDVQGTWRIKGGKKIILSVPPTDMEVDGLSARDIRDIARGAKTGCKVQRDAGTFFFAGPFPASREKSKRFCFRPQPEYGGRLEGLDLKVPAGDGEALSSTLFLCAVHDVSCGYAAEMKGAGYGGISLDQLMKLRAAGVTAQYVAALGEIGYRNLPPDHLVKLGALGVSTDYMKSLFEIGYQNVPVDDLILLRVHRVPIGFIQSVIGTSHPLPTIRELALIWIHGDKVSRFR